MHPLHPAHPLSVPACDTRPLPGRPSSAYAGRMIPRPASAIDRAGNSTPVIDSIYGAEGHTPPFCADVERKNAEAGHGLVDQESKIRKHPWLTRRSGILIVILKRFAEHRRSHPRCVPAVRRVYNPAVARTLPILPVGRLPGAVRDRRRSAPRRPRRGRHRPRRHPPRSPRPHPARRERRRQPPSRTRRPPRAAALTPRSDARPVRHGLRYARPQGTARRRAPDRARRYRPPSQRDRRRPRPHERRGRRSRAASCVTSSASGPTATANASTSSPRALRARCANCRTSISSTPRPGGSSRN